MKQIKTRPLWTDQIHMPENLGEDPLVKEIDLAVVGGGYSGLVTALRVAEAGQSVCVFDSGLLGNGASSRNGGKALVGLKHSAPYLVRKHGFEKGKALFEASIKGIDAIEDMVKKEKIDCDFERCGSFLAACKPAHYKRMCVESAWLSEHFGYERHNIPRSKMHEEIGSELYHGGVVDELSAGIHPAKYVLGLAQAAKRRGVLLHHHCSVNGIENRGVKFHLKTDKGTLEAKDVLVATNGYTGNLVPQIKRRVVSLGSYIIATEVLSEELQRSISPKGRMFYDSKWFLNYFRLTPDGRMFFGGRTTISPDQDLMVSGNLLETAMRETFPQLDSVPVTHTWGGKLGLSFDALPHIGQSDGIHYLMGFSGHGVAMSTYLGHHVAEMILGERQSSLFSEIAAPTRFFYRKRAWFRPLLGLGIKAADVVS